MKASESREALLDSDVNMSKDAPEFIMGPPVEAILKNEEKRFLLLVERGDVNAVKKYAKIYDLNTVAYH